MEKKSLNEILRDKDEIVRLLIESEGEETDEIKELMTINKNELDDKLERYYYVISDLENKADFEKTQKERFEHREKVLRNSAKRLKDAIDTAMNLYATNDPKSKAKIPSKKYQTDTVKFTAIAYPVIDPTTLPPVEALEKEIGAEYLDYLSNMKVTQEEAKAMQSVLSAFIHMKSSKDPDYQPPFTIPVFTPQLRTDLVKAELKEGVIIGDLKLDNNFKTRFS